MVRSLAAGLVAATALALPVSAAGHGAAAGAARTGLTAAERHRAADLAGVPVPALERRVRAIARRLGRRPGTRPRAARARAAAPRSPTPASRQLVGVIPAPIVPIFEALLPNGKILMWDSVGDAPAESYTDHTFTRAAVYDPATNTSKRVDVAGSNIFCAGFVQLANGNVFVAGGNADSALNGIRQTHTFDWRTETWSRGPDMQDGALVPVRRRRCPNDEAVIIGGGPDDAEVRTTSGTLRRADRTSTTPVGPRVPVPPGRARRPRAAARAVAAMSLIDTDGAGTLTRLGNARRDQPQLRQLRVLRRRALPGGRRRVGERGRPRGRADADRAHGRHPQRRAGRPRRRAR